MYPIIISEKRITSLMAEGIVTTLEGLREHIARGVKPAVIDKLTLTPRAAEYWAEYKKSKNESHLTIIK